MLRNSDLSTPTPVRLPNVYPLHAGNSSSDPWPERRGVSRVWMSDRQGAGAKSAPHLVQDTPEGAEVMGFAFEDETGLPVIVPTEGSNGREVAGPPPLSLH